jgi:type IV secretory pathway VirB2 component (pilin)
MKIAIKILAITLLCFQAFAIANEAPSSQNIVSVNPAQISSDGNTKNQSDLANALCTLILILNGRIARVIAAVAIFAIGIMFFMGKITWPVIVTIGVAMGLVFGAKVVAIALLPRAIQTYDQTQGEIKTTTTSEIISQACPELL